MIVLEPPSRGSSEAAFAAVRKQGLARFLKQARLALGLDGEVTVLLADDTRMRALNRSFRGKNKTTDVLSFPAAKNGEGAAGDLAISVPVAAAQAEAHGHGMAEELRILLLHGLLHLAGYDHEIDAGEMRAKEAELRARFKLPVSLIERTVPATKPATKNEPTRVATKRASRARTDEMDTETRTVPATQKPRRPAKATA